MTDELTYRQSGSSAELAQALTLRHNVFVVEEGRDRLVDADEIDETCQHLVAVLNDTVVGTLRLYLLHPGDTDIKIGRVAIRKDLRGRGIGRKLMETAHAWAINRYRSVYLHAQIQVAGFYEKLGYFAEGDIFEEAGTPHILMRLKDH